VKTLPQQVHAPIHHQEAKAWQETTPIMKIKKKIQA
jgi:hypothetical protein